jgi:hypothetical protein
MPRTKRVAWQQVMFVAPFHSIARRRHAHPRKPHPSWTAPGHGRRIRGRSHWAVHRNASPFERGFRDHDRRERDPRRDQVQLASHASVLNLVAEARLILSGVGAKYPAIALALLDRCGGRQMERARIADFPATVLSEAARAVNTQKAAQAVLLASARAEAGGAGRSGPQAIAALGDRFDELGAAAIEMGDVVCELDPFAMALFVFPVAQLAYYLYVQHHAPSARTGPDLVSLSAALTFSPGGAFDPDTAIVPFSKAHYATAKDHVLFDPTPCFTNIVKALMRVKQEVIEIYDDPSLDHPTKRWTGFVHRQEREVLSRREKHGLALSFTHVELVTLMREIQAFGVAARKGRHATTHITTMSPTHAMVQGSVPGYGPAQAGPYTRVGQ